MDFFKRLFEADFMPHGHCYFWKPDVLWSNVVGDVVIALSYFIIPFLLVRFLKKRQDVKFRALFLAFAIFILACGMTHVIDIIAVWHPLYRLEGLLKLITAGASAGTVAGLFYHFPTILSLPTPEAWSSAKAEIAKGENRFKTLLQRSPIGVAITSLEGNILDVNETLCQMFKHDRKSMQNLTFKELTHPDDMDASISARQGIISGSIDSFQLEKRCLRKDGSEFYAMVSAAVVKEEKVSIIYIMDITARKMAEKRIYDDNRLLETKVAERTKELAESNRDLENFINAITHDLRVPLHNLTGLTTALKEDLTINDNSEARSILEMIGQNAGKMDELVVDLLSFSNTGQQELKKEKIDVEGLIKEIFQELIPLYAKNEVDFQVGKLPPAFGDKTALHKIWMNLISNALKYSSKKDKIKIEISGWEEDGHTIYKIQDFGAGYDPRYHKKLFNLFQRLHHPEDYEGSGLGLAISSRLVDKHGGKMWSESELGEGASFYFSLPGHVNTAPALANKN